MYLTAENYKLQIYPNPANSVIQVSISNGQLTAYCLYDMLGNILIQQTIEPTNQTSINISGLAAGSYMLKVQNENNTLSYTQIIKQ